MLSEKKENVRAHTHTHTHESMNTTETEKQSKCCTSKPIKRPFIIHLAKNKRQNVRSLLQTIQNVCFALVDVYLQRLPFMLRENISKLSKHT